MFILEKKNIEESKRLDCFFTFSANSLPYVHIINPIEISTVIITLIYVIDKLILMQFSQSSIKIQNKIASTSFHWNH